MNITHAGKHPTIHETSWVAPNATLVGDVELGPGVSVWYGAVLRADVDRVTVGDRSNIQDGCILHADRGQPLTIGAGVSVGPGSILHGAKIDDEVAVGSGATVLDGAHIGTGSLIAAGALVPRGAVIPPRSLVVGVPGRVRRAVTDEEYRSILDNAAAYVAVRSDDVPAPPPAPTAGTKRVPRNVREEQILDVAAELFSRHGFAGTSMADIAEAAGVSKPLVHNYFGSRDGLHLACVRRAGEPLLRAVEAAQDSVDPGTRAARTIRAILTTLADRRHDWGLVFDTTLPPDAPGGAAAHAYRRSLNELGAHGVDETLSGLPGPDDRSLLTHLWFGTVTATIRWWQDRPDDTAEETALRFERVIDAVTRSPSSG